MQAALPLHSIQSCIKLHKINCNAYLTSELTLTYIDIDILTYIDINININIDVNINIDILTYMDAEAVDLWESYKNGVLKACDDLCGKTKGRRDQGNTWWWNEQR